MRVMHNVPIAPPATPAKRAKRAREPSPPRSLEQLEVELIGTINPLEVDAKPVIEVKKRKPKSSTYARKTKVDPHVAKMDARLASLNGSLSGTISASVQQKLAEDDFDSDFEPLHGPFEDPAGGVQPAITACKWSPTFIPAASPLSLIQEKLYYCPYRLLVATIFLNKTRGAQARPILQEFLARYPTPEACCQADVDKLAKLLFPLGLYNRRARSLKLFARSYIDNFAKIVRLTSSASGGQTSGDETDSQSASDGFRLSDLYGSWWRISLLMVQCLIIGRSLSGIGKYASDSFFLFCGDGEAWRTLSVDDKELKKYVAWRRKSLK